MMKVRDFAEKVGCTPQNVYLHLKNYAKELEGHTEKGRRGIMLDDYACDFIRNVMYPKEISADNEVMAELNRLRGLLLEMGNKNQELGTRLAIVEGEREKAQYEAEYHQKALAASKEEQEAQAAALEQARKELEDRAAHEAELQQQLDAEREARAQAESREQALKDRNLWQRIMRKGE